MTKPIMKVICMNKEYITLMELAQSLKISRTTIDRWRKEGMPSYKIGNALYGKIEFSALVYKCMLSPEVQRLREVRLCNINSLCITGSSNTNRFEHSVGTA